MKVLNFGSLNIDYTYHVSHFVQKGETLLSDMSYVYSGGKGLNQSIALKRAGVDVFHAGAVGTDGNLLVELLKDSGVDTRFIKISPIFVQEMQLSKMIAREIIVLLYMAVRTRQLQKRWQMRYCKNLALGIF